MDTFMRRLQLMCLLSSFSAFSICHPNQFKFKQAKTRLIGKKSKSSAIPIPQREAEMKNACEYAGVTLH